MRRCLALACAIVCGSAAAPLHAQSLTTLFAGGNSGTTSWTNQFDLTVTSPSGLRITAFDVNCENTRSGGVGSPFTLNVWVTALGGTYVGNQTNASAWTQVSTGNGISRAIGTPTSVDVADFSLATGTYGVALEYNGTAMAYTNGTGANQVHSTPDLTLSAGSSTTGLFGAPVYDPRVWNGTIYYFVQAATWRSFEPGCSGGGSTPRLAPAAGSAARIGQTFTLNVSGLPLALTPVFLQLGLSSSMWHGAPVLPFSLQPLGAPNCALLVSDELILSGSGVQTTSFALGIPSVNAYIGAHAYFQALVFLPGANALGVLVSNGGDAYVGT